MKNIKDERQDAWRQLMQNRFKREIEALDSVECMHTQEIINAVAGACCWQKLRNFQGEVVGAEFFRGVAQVASFETFCVAVQALARAELRGPVYNRIWYILGVFVRIKPQAPNPHRQSHIIRDGYKQRQYTPEELAGIVRPMDSFTEADL